MESPFSGMLKTNYIPLDTEVEQIRQLITGQVEMLLRLEELITHLSDRDLIDDLTQDRDALNEYIQDHHALISGARRMPRDVVEEVFIHCLSADHNARMRSYEAPIKLGRICGSWREICLTCPRLWSSLHVDADSVPDDKLQLQVEAAEIWLIRSGARLLSLSFSVRPHDYRNGPLIYESETIQQLMHVFSACSRRWKSLDISMPMSSFSSWSPSLTTVDVPMLEVVKFRLLDPSPKFDTSMVLPMILRAQSLRIISLSGAMDQPSTFAPYWGRLTTLSLLSTWGRMSSLGWQCALVVLHHASNLKKCSLQLSSESSPSLPAGLPQGVTTLLHLESFRLDALGSRQILTDFLDMLIMPSLKHLAISTDAGALSNIPFASFLTQPDVIETMELKLHAFPPDRLMELLAFVPSLRGLCLVENVVRDYGSILNRDIIKQLTPNTSGYCLCPRLEEVRICAALADNSRLFKFLKTRINSEHLGVTRLQRAVLAFAQWGRLVDYDEKRLNENLRYMPDYVHPITDYHWRKFDEAAWKKGWAYSDC